MAGSNPFSSSGDWGNAASGSRAISSAGAAVGDLFAAEGLGISADGYRRAAAMSRESLGYTEQNNKIKMLMAERQIYQTIGGQQNDLASAGLAFSGGALDLMRDSAAQGELTRSTVELQGKIDVNTINQQINAYETQAEAADKAEEGKYWSAGINAISAVVSAASFFAGG